MITKVKTNSHEEWLAERKKSLGGSDVAAVLGMNEHVSAYTVWAEKTGRLPPFKGNEWTRLGNDLEFYVAQRFSEASGLKVVNDTNTWRNDKYPHLHANFDRKVVGMKAGLECKITSELNAKNYKGGEFPGRFYAQCVEYLAVTEYDRWYLAVLIYGKGLKIYQMTRKKNDKTPFWCEASVYVDEEEIESLVFATSDFWNGYVLTNNPPLADGSKSTADSIRTLYPESDGTAVDLMAFETDLAQYMTLSEAIDGLKNQKEEVANRIKSYMGEASRGMSERFKVTWNSSTRSTFDHKRFMAENPGFDMYYKSTPTRTFKVSEK